MSTVIKYTIKSNPTPLLLLARTASGLRQEDLAARSGLSRNAVAEAERGKRCSSGTALLVARALGLPMDDKTLELLETAQPATWEIDIRLVEEIADGDPDSNES